MEKHKVVVIGAGFGGLGAAILMARKGYDVTVLEKNDKVGGRANLLEKDGFKRDMGPSWYLMPDAFERYFEAIGRNVSDYLDLKKLEPSYRVFFKNPNCKDLLDPLTPLCSAQDDRSKFIDLYADIEKAAETFESIEQGSGDQLKKYLKLSAYQYDIAINKFVFKNYDSIFDFMTPQLAIEGLQLNVFSSLYSYVSRFVKTENLKKILMYPSVFLGTSPYQTPALFNIMSHVDFNQGVFYPQGGIYEVPKALYEIALEEGVKFEFGTEVEKIVVEGGEVKGVEIMKRHREGSDSGMQKNIQQKPNIIVLHGKKRPERNSNKEGWFGWIENQLISTGYDVKLPFIDDSWKKGRTGWKEGIQEFQDSINENTILVGHSAGAAALVRWLGETGRKIKKLILVAPGYLPEKDKTISTQTGLPIDPQEQLEYNTLFDFDVDGSILDQIEDGVILFTSNDSQRLLDSAAVYKNTLGVKHIILEDRGHFNTSYGPQNLVFEELFDVITKENIDTISIENIDTFVRENLQFPIMIHGFEKSGASFFTIELVKKLIQQGKKVLFYSKYQAAKDALVENGSTYEFVGGGHIANSDSLLQIYHDGDDQAFADYLQKIPLDDDRIIIVKNFETCGEKLLNYVSDKTYVVSGDCTQLYPTFVGKIISFSELGNYDISHLKQYEAIVVDKDNSDSCNNIDNQTPTNIVTSNADMRHTETKLLEIQPTLQQKAELFQKVFALAPWNDSMTIQEAAELVQKIEKIEGFFENHIEVDGVFVGGSFSIKLTNGVPFEFENLITQEEFTQHARSVYSDYDPELTWNGRNTFIDPVYQNQGYGKKLFNLNEQKSINMGAKFRVVSTLANSFQQKFLEKEGYTVFWNTQNFGNEIVYLIKKLHNFRPAKIVISNADMRHTETKLLDSAYQTYPQSYWEKQVISPSGFIMYLGVDEELPQLKHHTLVFNDDWKTGFDQIFKTPIWPDDPSYYICNPSKTDPSVAPLGKENLFVLVPIAPGLVSTPESLQQYADKILDDMAVSCDVPDLKKRVEVCELFSVPQFEQYYNAYKGTALGLAHTMFQSAVWRPNNYSKKAKGLYYSGGYTTPGIGMPMCLISAMLVAERIFKKNS